jgi:acyl-CoA reductase-like NAD-dependent aldehyde dehydrogenase
MYKQIRMRPVLRSHGGGGLEGDQAMSSLKLISPVDGSVYAERPVMALDDAAEPAVARSRKAQKDWARRPLDERIALVKAGVARLNDMNDEVVPELAWMMGRPVRYGGEFGGVNERTNYMAEIAARALAPIEIENSAQFERRIVREAHGVVFVIAPWNYPYMTAINTVAPALIAGNTVVLKHATQTLLVGERMVRAFHEAGVPEDVFINLFLDHQGTEKLISAGSFNFINFTGSVGGGKAIERAAAGHLHRSGSRAWRQGSGLCDGRCRSRLGRRRADGRSHVQCRAVLLRHRTALCREPAL